MFKNKILYGNQQPSSKEKVHRPDESRSTKRCEVLASIIMDEDMVSSYMKV